jgi:lipopolysaccharide biosynthesis regulator YciM
MDFDLSWILLGLPVAFVLGWLASRLDLRQLRIENRQAPKAYFKGLNYLLNEQQDQAIDAFIEAVQTTPTLPSCTLPWATCFAAAASTNARSACMNICCRAAT